MFVLELQPKSNFRWRLFRFQNHSTLLPSSSTKQCVKIVRVEFGTLAELTILLIKFAKGRLLPNSLICQWSASHLAEVETANYATRPEGSRYLLHNAEGRQVDPGT